MSIALLIGDDDTALDLYALNLEMYVGCEILRKNSYIEAIELLKVLPRLDIIISLQKIEAEGTISILDKYLIQQSKETPLVVLGTDIELLCECTHVKLTTDLKPLLKIAAKILGVNAKSMVTQVVPDFYPISINYFTCLAKSFCVIYEKVGDGYEILFEDGLDINQEDINDRVTSRIASLYVTKENRLKFVAQVTKTIISQLADNKLSTNLRLKSTDATMVIVRDQIGVNLEGLDTESIALATAAIASLSTVVEQAPSLKNLLHTLLNNQTSFLYKHSQLTTYLCFHAIDNMEWGTAEQKEKLAFIAFFHDIALARDELAMIESEAQLDDAKISADDKDRISKHALSAANLIKDFPKAPIGVDTIIKQHHGSRSGVGFASHFGDNISPLAIVFIVCEALCCKILSAEVKDKRLSSAVDDLHYRFTSQKYSNVLRALDSLELG